MDEHRTRIQIFGAEHRQDALALADLGVDCELLIMQPGDVY